MIAGGTPPRSNSAYFGGSIAWVKISDMLQGRIVATEESLTPDGLSACRAKVLPKGTLLISIFATVGRTAVLDIPAATNQAIVGVRPRKNETIDTGYLRYFLDSYANTLIGQSRGVAQNNVNASMLKGVVVPLPPFAEQKRIAAILDKADAIRRRRQEATRLCEDLLASGFAHIVGPLASDYRQWDRRTIEYLASPEPRSMRTGPFGSDLLHSEFVNEGVAVLGIDNAVKNRFTWDERRYITPEKYDELQRFTVKPNDVIITIMGTTGRSAVVPDDIPLAITTKHLATVTLDRGKAEPEFVSNAMHRHPEILGQIASANRGAIMSGLNLGLIKKLELPVPPIDVQREFTRYVRDVRDLERLHATKQDTADDLFNSLVQRAFRGEL